MTYRKKVLRYFRLEYSDQSLLWILGQIRVYESSSHDGFTTIRNLGSENKKVSSKKKRWVRKLQEIVTAHQRAGHVPSIPAQKIASILQAATGTHFLN